jgi:1,4-dihydroxy-2-naphthoate octaprenyltransferase
VERIRANIISIFDRDTFLHLRLPFSIYLLPVFSFGISQALNYHTIDLVIVFIALHFFIYPGSNIYNSYMDNDTGSIGGLKNPPPVTRKLYYASIVTDITGLLLCSLAGWANMLVMSGYVAFSKAYSWRSIRLKKYALLGWIMVAFFQGGYTYMLANMAASGDISLSWFTPANRECMVIATLLIGAYYPLTQIYQHEDDSRNGDFTISYRLGIIGTFLFSACLFLCGSALCYHYFVSYYSIVQFYIFLACTAPILIYFLYWFTITMKDRRYADYDHAMLMTKISSACMTICFTIIWFINNYLK